MKAGRFVFQGIAICLVQLLLSSCGDDDLKKVEVIKKISLNVDRTKGVEIIYSDSAKVKAKGYAPVLDKVTPSSGSPYQEMPNGVKIQFLDEFQKITGTITSDYAIMKETEKLIIFKRNVVVVNQTMTFNTEELIWDQNKQMFFSPKGIVTNPDGSFADAVNFSAPQNFSTYSTGSGNGEAFINGKLGE
ncbi:LPS export ABC transporter periplasmic protein LptC [Pedobacter sp. MC2016-24]|uniref:LPS export ABC transporter periplasmic protein LptC n=1 Tax=Pedobacter sp. MC2016-24 TaxID=2780090 RepID=UPI001D1650AB|nr:LPS export ABC transporter periplasmic protein LptC [Pedobacter sp. MC2016-24]